MARSLNVYIADRLFILSKSISTSYNTKMVGKMSLLKINTVDRYLIKETTTSILLIMGALLAMFAFFDLLQELESVGKGSYGIVKIVAFVLLSTPGHFYEIVPVAVLIGSIYSLGQLSRNSELIILRVSGMSILNIGMTLIRIGLVFAVITFVVGEMITPISEKTGQRMRIKAIDSVIAQDFRSGLWVKDGKNFVNVEQVLPDAQLVNIHIYEFDENFEMKAINQAKTGTYNGESWDLTDLTQTNLAKTNVESTHLAQSEWKSLIRPELMSILLVVPEKMSAWNLYSYISHLNKSKQKTSRYDIALWAKIIYPLACLVMVILALPFGFLQQRSGGAVNKLFAGVLLGILYQVLNRVSLHLGLLNDWTALTSAVLPTFLFLMTGIFMLIWVERQ
jgi:lipopolysaccharide export system permease protein